MTESSTQRLSFGLFLILIVVALNGVHLGHALPRSSGEPVFRDRVPGPRWPFKRVGPYKNALEAEQWEMPHGTTTTHHHSNQWERDGDVGRPHGTLTDKFNEAGQWETGHRTNHSSLLEKGGYRGKPYGTQMDGFNVSFTNHSQVLELFEEGDFHLTTGHSSACARPDHLEYNFSLPDCGDCHGLRIRMDNVNATCSRSASISTGHLESLQYLGYGDFEIMARTAHSKEGGHPPSNAFTCFSAYTSHPVHDEIALCWPPYDTGIIHMGHWNGKNGDHEHRTDLHLGFDASAGYHRYKFQWRNDSITYVIDGQIVHRDTGDTMPVENMSMRIILRPDNVPSVYEGEALYTIRFASYTPAADSVETEDTAEKRARRKPKSRNHREKQNKKTRAHSSDHNNPRL